MGKKKILALVLSLCFLIFPVLTACSSTDIQNALSSLTQEDIDNANSVINSVISDYNGNNPDIKPDNNGGEGGDVASNWHPGNGVNPDHNGNGNNGNGNNGNDNNGNNGNGNGPGGNSGSDNNDNVGNGNGNNSGGNGNGGSIPNPEPEPPKPNEPTAIVDQELGLTFTLSDDGFYYSVSATKPVSKTKLVIPRVYDGINVTAIASNGFSGCIGLESVTIPDSVAYIGGFAFFRCENLTSITIPSSVESIGAYAFDGCSSLTIYSPLPSAPNSWDKKWNPDKCPVVWNFSCEHEWQDATCVNPYVCSICGMTEGEALGHEWVDVTCTDAKHCIVCKITEGDAPGHTWVDATCTDAKHCSVCDYTEGEALGHDIKDGHCTRCDYEEPNLTADGNIASLATITEASGWWACKPEFLVDGKLNTATLTSTKMVTTTFNFVWDACYDFTTIKFYVNGTGKAPIAEVDYNEKTFNSFYFDVIFYDDLGNAVFVQEDVFTDGLECVTLDVDCTAQRMVMVIRSQWMLYPIFEIQTFTVENPCAHIWQSATCTAPSRCIVCERTRGEELGHIGGERTCTDKPVCDRCGESYGDKLDHLYRPATCTTPSYCALCKEEFGEPLGHDFSEATCQHPKICGVCRYTEGEKLTHEFSEADCSNPATCTLCGATSDPALGHIWEDGACSRCGMTKNIIGIEDIETILPSHSGPGSTNLECLFDGERISSGIYDKNSTTEYFPSQAGDYLTIVLNEPTYLESAVVWIVGNWTIADIEFYDEYDNLLGTFQIVYEGSFYPGDVATPITVNFDQILKVKTVILRSVQIKWESGATQKTPEIELFRAPAYERNENTIYFGSYPSSSVEDEDLIDSLNAFANGMPSKENAGDWTDYGYYSNGEVDSFMWYIDIEFNGEKYRGVYLADYRASFTNQVGSESTSLQEKNGYLPNKAYWFKYEPISWQIMSEGDNCAFLLCNSALESLHFDTVSNDYKESFIRSWLNDTFYNTAFNSQEQSIIAFTELEEGVTDKVFLLSKEELDNFALSSTSTWRATTDYAQAQGAEFHPYAERGNWWLRSAGGDENTAMLMSQFGSSFGKAINYTSACVVPVIIILL